MRSPTPRQWTAIALAAVLMPALTITVWPLLLFLHGLLPEALPVGRILLGTLFAAGLAATAALARSKTREKKPVGLGWLILTAWTVAIAAVAGIVLLAWLVLGSPSLEDISQLSPRDLDALATRAFAVVAGLSGVALLVIAYRRQRTTEADAERQNSKLFTETFDSASDKLGNDHSAVRLAGVHALARLADEAPKGRGNLVQMVIDVLCAYLRMPYVPAPDPPGDTADDDQITQYRDRKLEFDSLQEVRHTIFRIIQNRLGRNTNTCWHGKNYDFTGAVIDGGSLSGATFSGGTVDFRKARFVHDNVHLRKVKFSGATVDFRWACFDSGGAIFRKAEFSGGTVDFREAEFNGAKVSFLEAEFSGATVDFREAKFNSGKVTYRDASGPCPTGLVEAIENASSEATVILPEQWASGAAQSE